MKKSIMETRELTMERGIGPVFARFFSSGVLQELAHTGRSSIAGRLSRDYHLFDQFDSKMEVGAFYDLIFKQLIRRYRHEYIYKNAVAEKILLGKHNLNTAMMLTEFHADDCIADVVVLNGTSHVYEIKSEMDSLDRLDRQITAYRKIFDYITVITTERLFTQVEQRLPKEIGIMVLANDKYCFRKSPYRAPVSNKRFVEPLVILNSLQRREYLKIIKEYYDIDLTHLPNTLIYQEATKYFENLPPENAHDGMVAALKKRRDAHRIAEFVIDVPNSLKAASLTMHLTTDERTRFIGALHRNISVVFM